VTGCTPGNGCIPHLAGVRNNRMGKEGSLGALNKLTFSADELKEIRMLAADGGIDLWRKVSRDKPL
jgi:hypothetical protein